MLMKGDFNVAVYEKELSRKFSVLRFYQKPTYYTDGEGFLRLYSREQLAYVLGINHERFDELVGLGGIIGLYTVDHMGSKRIRYLHPRYGVHDRENWEELTGIDGGPISGSK